VFEESGQAAMAAAEIKGIMNDDQEALSLKGVCLHRGKGLSIDTLNHLHGKVFQKAYKI